MHKFEFLQQVSNHANKLNKKKNGNLKKII